MKLQQEYQDYQKKLEQQKAEYRKEHPDEVSTFFLNNLSFFKKRKVTTGHKIWFWFSFIFGMANEYFNFI